MAWTEDIYPHFEPFDPHAFQIFPAPQQPTTILQQLPATVMPPGSASSIRPGGHVKEDLVELMMIQNTQMHQVIINNMTMSALSSFGYFSPPLGPEAPRDLVIIQENEADLETYHHYYPPASHLSSPAWLLPQATLGCKDPNKPTSSPPLTDRPAPPPSSSGTVGAHVMPAAESNSAAEAGAEKKRESDY
ncbi:proline-rich protein 29-like [Plectropomus leopardus]|uniref:proline-rich protein 29-like n=1 Tax=Plectropomus leopardus TaxID=160734 RepID=UPI001C4D3473|nr:proline-rich protein 29-like [Plectropomus leopardus]